jgi:hypothetical protein
MDSHDREPGKLMTAIATETIPVTLEATCGYGSCAELAWRFKKQLGVDRYSRGASIQEMPDTLDEWRAGHRTARKRADRAARLGYRFAEINRPDFSDDIHDINVSLAVRQGRPMADGYLSRQTHGPLPPQPCGRHRIHTYGVLQDDTLRAYMTLYRCGGLSLISMILGHGDHLRDDIMYLLAAGMIAAHAADGGVLFYNRHDSGTDGLRYYKERLGFAERDVEFML